MSEAEAAFLIVSVAAVVALVMLVMLHR